MRHSFYVGTHASGLVDGALGWYIDGVRVNPRNGEWPMRVRMLSWSVVLAAVGTGVAMAQAPIGFETVVVDPDAGIVPAVSLADVEGDGDLDIVAMANERIGWYENPGWSRHEISPALEGLNVCMALADLDGDGLPEIAAGADWQFENTSGGGALYVLVRREDVKAPWRSAKILTEPSLHRIRWADSDGDGAPELYVAPLKGRDTTGPDFREAGVRLLQLRPPKDLLGAPWPVSVVTQSYHIMHNLIPFRAANGRDQLLTASFEGLTLLHPEDAGTWSARALHAGCPQPWPRSGSSEVKTGHLAAGAPVMATVEPWHGNMVVVYTPDAAGPLESVQTWHRQVLDESFNQGHALGWADFDGDGRDELVAGHREPSPKTDRVGLKLYRFDGFTPGTEPAVAAQFIDDGGMATEDLALGDLNGDGVPDIVAVGRSSHNIKVYLTKKP